jgi:predicted amidophosphoribosyltransferase
MRVIDLDAIRGRDVLLLDDVTTTGNSLQSARAHLIAADARSVKMAALGKTV